MDRLDPARFYFLRVNYLAFSTLHEPAVTSPYRSRCRGSQSTVLSWSSTSLSMPLTPIRGFASAGRFTRSGTGVTECCRPTLSVRYFCTQTLNIGLCPTYSTCWPRKIKRKMKWVQLWSCLCNSCQTLQFKNNFPVWIYSQCKYIQLYKLFLNNMNCFDK